MVPCYYPGDHILTFNWIVPKENDAIVFKNVDKFLVKRVKRVRVGYFICEGDNKKYSKTNYKVRMKKLFGKVILKY